MAIDLNPTSATATAMKEKEVWAVVFQIMDNTIFMALTEEGVQNPTQESREGLPHGCDLNVCDRPVLCKLLKI
jgi:hypothetical protein